MNGGAILRTGRLVMTPVNWGDLPALQALKGDPRVFAIMLGRVRSPLATQDELAAEISLWGREGVGIWAVRTQEDGRFIGITGLMERPDGRGLSLRFAFVPEVRGRGLAREAASAALRFAHDEARIPRVIAVAREDNFASRTVLGGIGMREAEGFERGGHRMLVYESVRRPSPSSDGR